MFLNAYLNRLINFKIFIYILFRSIVIVIIYRVIRVTLLGLIIVCMYAFDCGNVYG
jgi:hypothetical protein